MLNILGVTGFAYTSSGRISKDETWTGRIRITGDIVIPSGVQLTILPGSIIEIASGSDDQISGIDNSHTELVVDGGALQAVGTFESPISFISQASQPRNGDWYGIRIAKGNVHLNFCLAQYFIDGINVQESAVGAGVVVEDCWFRNGTKGLVLAANRAMEFRRCQIIDISIPSGNDSGGIESRGNFDPSNRSLLLDDCLLSHVQWAGLQVNGALTIQGTVFYKFGNAGLINNSINPANVTTIRRSIFLLTGQSYLGVFGLNGFPVAGAVGCMYSSLRMDSSIVFENNFGLMVGKSCEVTHSLLGDNETYGLLALGSARVTNSIVVGNEMTGVSLWDSDSVLTGSLVRDNAVGVESKVKSSTLSGVIGNDIYDNNQYDLAVYEKAPVVASENWWGKKGQAELEDGLPNLSFVYDSRDQFGLGQAVLRNSSPISLTSFDVPEIVTQPQRQLTEFGQRIVLVVGAIGKDVTYQWLKNNTPIKAGTNKVYEVVNSAEKDAGLYQVIAMGPAGKATSSVAQVIVLPSSSAARISSSRTPQGVELVLEGKLGSVHSIQFTTELGPNARWITLSNVTIKAGKSAFLDTDVAGVSTKFYRARWVP